MSTYLNTVDTEKVQTLLEETDKNVAYFNEVGDKIVATYCENLDSIMKNIYTEIIMPVNPTLETMEKYFLQITNALYFMGEKLERLGIYDDMSKAAAKEIYNSAYLANQLKGADGKNKTTVAENQAVAESESIYEATVNNIYARSYKLVKFKMDAAQTMISTLSKLISRRIQENAFASAIPQVSQPFNPYQPTGTFVDSTPQTIC